MSSTGTQSFFVLFFLFSLFFFQKFGSSYDGKTMTDMLLCRNRSTFWLPIKQITHASKQEVKSISINLVWYIDNVEISDNFTHEVIGGSFRSGKVFCFDRLVLWLPLCDTSFTQLSTVFILTFTQTCVC